jgi:SAM-dependent methyltransferase/DNA-directed RNA polymerase subunit RPC12/RpoP
VRWVEHYYNVECPRCGKHTPLGNGDKHRNETGRAVDGQYDCVHCSEKIKAASAPRTSSTMLNLRYRCSDCGEHATAEPLASDVQKFSYCIQNEDELAASLGLKIPDDAIPVEWDRQQEDCLHRKGFKQFKDFFTPRNRLISALYFAALDELRPQITSDEYLFLLLNLSALLRYTNNMTFCVDGWMDGRPVAWAKHAYWTPNQFIECNPLEYFGNRVKASVSGLKDRRTRFSKFFQHGEPREVLDGTASFSVENASSESVDLPDKSVDLVLTDPPYGSNVQYGELCHFWAVWLKGRLPFEPKLFDLQQEILVHRKKSSEVVPKTFDDYQQGLTRVFKECFRILKSGGHLVFTFNNKNPKAWFSVIRAALDAGFEIEERGVTYQGEIEAYRDTAHQRHDGTAKGDFIYTFIRGNLDERITSSVRYDQRQLDLNIFEDIEEGEYLNSAAERQMFSLIQAIRNGACENELSHIMKEMEEAEVALV